MRNWCCKRSKSVILKLIEKIFGSDNAREIKRIEPIVEHINSFEPDMEKRTDDELKCFNRRIQKAPG